MKRIGMLGLVLVLIALVSLGSMTIAQGPDRRGGPARQSGGHKLPVAPETPANDEYAETAAAETADAAAADTWEPDLGVVEGPGLRAGAYSFVGGGRKNKADGAYSSVVGATTVGRKASTPPSAGDSTTRPRAGGRRSAAAETMRPRRSTPR